MATARVILACLGLLVGASTLRAQVSEVLRVSSPDYGDFGRSLALDGDVAFIGAPDQSTLGWFVGAVHVYQRDATGAWVKQTELVGNDSENGDNFGLSIALQGNRALIGGGDQDAQGSTLGAGYVFERQPDGAWLQTAKITSPAPGLYGGFATGVALDGDRALLEGPSLIPATSDIHVFELGSGGTWQATAVLSAADAAEKDFFGSDFALSGERALVGAKWDDLPAGSKAGSARVFERQAGGTWSEVALLVGSGASYSDHFGESVALQGGLAIVGAPWDSELSDHGGSVYVFERQADGTWLETALLHNSEAKPYDYFGADVALDGDLLVAASWQYNDHGKDAGAFWVFRHERDGHWTELHRVEASYKSSQQGFGYQIALSGHRTLTSTLLTEDAYIHELLPLTARASTIPLAGGGVQSLALDAGYLHAQRPYVLLGSARGTSPGVLLGGFVLPLVPDAYFHLTLVQPAATPLVGATGTLNANGFAQAAFVLPAGLPPALAGLTLHHAFIALDASHQVEFASNALPVTLVP